MYSFYYNRIYYFIRWKFYGEKKYLSVLECFVNSFLLILNGFRYEGWLFSACACAYGNDGCCLSKKLDKRLFRIFLIALISFSPYNMVASADLHDHNNVFFAEETKNFQRNSIPQGFLQEHSAVSDFFFHLFD